MFVRKGKLWLTRFALLLLMLALLIQIPVLPVAAVQGDGTQAVVPLRFPDVSDKAWYAADLRFITSDARRILEGSTDGHFYPENKLSVEQFLKCVVVAANQRPAASGGHWARPFIEKANEMGIVTSNQFSSYQAEITRGEMAVVIASAFVPMTGETKPSVDHAVVSKRMKDYGLISENQREAVCMAYSIGILTGMPDGKFHPEGILSRAEAVAVIRRVIDPSARIKVMTDPKDPVDPLDPGSSGVSGTSEVWSDKAFQEFMSTDEWKKYLNPNTIAGMEDGVLLFYNLEFPGENDESTIVGDAKRVPYMLAEPLYTKYYDIAKTLGYYAKMNNAKTTVGYFDEMGGMIAYDFSPDGGWIGSTPNVFFEVRNCDISRSYPHLAQHFPETKDLELSFEWKIESLNSFITLNEFYESNDVRKKTLEAEKNILILKEIASIMYEVDDPTAFIELILDKYEDVTQGSKAYEIPGVECLNGIRIFSYYPTAFGSLRFYSNEVEVK